MKNLMHHHPSEEVRAAMVKLADAFTQYERSTGRNYLIIVKAEAPGGEYEYRSLSGGPASNLTTDEDLLKTFAAIADRRPWTAPR